MKMADVYDTYGEVVARRFNYAGLRIDNIMQEAQENVKQIVRAGEMSVRYPRSMELFIETGQFVYTEDTETIFGYCKHCKVPLRGTRALGLEFCSDFCIKQHYPLRSNYSYQDTLQDICDVAGQMSSMYSRL